MTVEKLIAVESVEIVIDIVIEIVEKSIDYSIVPVLDSVIRIVLRHDYVIQIFNGLMTSNS